MVHPNIDPVYGQPQIKGGITPIAAFAFAPLLGYFGDKVVVVIMVLIINGVVVIAIRSVALVQKKIVILCITSFSLVSKQS